jgi:TolB-like protein
MHKQTGLLSSWRRGGWRLNVVTAIVTGVVVGVVTFGPSAFAQAPRRAAPIVPVGDESEKSKPPVDEVSPPASDSATAPNTTGAATERAASAKTQPTTATPAHKPRLLVLDFASDTKEADDAAKSIRDLVTSGLVDADGFEVLSGSDLTEMISLEADKAAAGCSEADCLAEIAGALGAEFVVTGRVGKLGTLYVVKVSMLEPARARTVVHETYEVESLEALAFMLKPAGVRMTALAQSKTVPKGFAQTEVEDEYYAAYDAAAPVTEVEKEKSLLASTLLYSGLGFLGTAFATGVLAVCGVGYALYIVQNPKSAGDPDKALARIGGTAALAVGGGALLVFFGSGVVTIFGAVLE